MGKTEKMIGYTSRIEDDILYMEFGKLNKESALEAAQTFKSAIEKPEVKKSFFIGREGFQMLGAFGIFDREVKKMDTSHLTANAIVLISNALKILVQKIIPKDDPTDTKIFAPKEETLALNWIKAWESKEQAQEWLKQNK
jgi:hypothetical protein